MKNIIKTLNILLLTFILLQTAAFAQETGLSQESYQSLPFSTYTNNKGESVPISEGQSYFLLTNNNIQNSELSDGWYLLPETMPNELEIGDVNITGTVNLILGINSPVLLNGNFVINKNSTLNIYAQNSNVNILTIRSDISPAVISGEGTLNNYSGKVKIENSNPEEGLCITAKTVNSYNGSLNCVNQNKLAQAVVASTTRLSLFGGEFNALTGDNPYSGMPIGTVPSIIKGNSLIASRDAFNFQSSNINGLLIALDSFDDSEGNDYSGNAILLGSVTLNNESCAQIHISNLDVLQGSNLLINEGQTLKIGSLQNDGKITVEKGGNLHYNSLSGDGLLNNKNSNKEKAKSQNLGDIDDSLNNSDGTESQAVQSVTGIKPSVEEIYVSSAKPYFPINNLVTEPFEEPITDNVSFSSASFQITHSGTGANYKLTAPSSTFNGNTIVTASYQIGNEDYSTSFSVNFVPNPNVNVSGINVPDQLSFNLINPNTQNVSATLTPINCTNYNQNIPYVSLFTYSSSDSSIASIDKYGNITPVAEGTCTITTSFTSGSASYQEETEVIVINENIGSITLTPLLLNLNLDDKKTGTIKANIYPEDLGLIPSWSVSNDLIAEIKPNGLEVEITALSVGTVTITASCMGENVTATVRVTQSEIYPQSISVFPKAVYLATQGTIDATVFSVVTANMNPGEATGNITWTSDTDIFSFNPSPDGRTVSIVPKDKQGFGYLTATAQGQNGEIITTKCPVTISNKPVVVDAYRNYIENSLFTSSSPDNFKVNVYPIANPAMKAYEGKNVRQVTIFCWSNLGQTDMNCKVANYESDGRFSYTFPVNGNTVNNYFDRACTIKVSYYGSFEFENGNLINSFYYNYVTPNDFSSNVAVTPYVQDLGFETPTVGNGELAGTEGRNLQLEGLRLSTPIDGLGLVYDVHVEDFGWMDQVTSGMYCGTMHLNKQIEAVHIKLTGVNAPKYTVRYQVHASNIGWMDWVSDGAQAGTVGEHRQIEAIRVSITPK